MTDVLRTSPPADQLRLLHVENELHLRSLMGSLRHDGARSSQA